MSRVEEVDAPLSIQELWGYRVQSVVDGFELGAVESAWCLSEGEVFFCWVLGAMVVSSDSRGLGLGWRTFSW